MKDKHGKEIKDGHIVKYFTETLDIESKERWKPCWMFLKVEECNCGCQKLEFTDIEHPTVSEAGGYLQDFNSKNYEAFATWK